MVVELRVDPIVPTRVSVISTARRLRPKEITSVRHEARGYSARCPFCPGNEELTPTATLAIRVVNGGLEYYSESEGTRHRDWAVRVFPNRYPIFTVDSSSGFGYHEVVVETPKHSARPHELSSTEWGLAFTAAFRRVRDYLSDQRVRYVAVIKNHGGGGGASLRHPHMQVMGVSVALPVVLEELRYSATKYREGACPYCKLLESELGSARHVYSNDRFAVIAAYAPRQSFEAWILPRRHENMPPADPGSLLWLGDALSKLFNAYYRVLGELDFNLWTHMMPGARSYHWHIEVVPAVPIWGGLEKGYGIYAVSVSPEDAANALRGACS